MASHDLDLAIMEFLIQLTQENDIISVCMWSYFLCINTQLNRTAKKYAILSRIKGTVLDK